MNKEEKAKLIKSESREIRKILNEWNLIPLSPEDEYDCLVNQIISELHKGSSEGTIELFIRREIIDHFGIKVEENNIKEVSAKIWNYWRNNKED